MASPTTTRISARRNTYTAYSIACAAVWGVILVVAQRRLDPPTRKTLWLTFGAWWTGWTSATIARVVYPPPKQLKPGTEKRLRVVSLQLIAAGLINVIRLLARGKPATRAATDG